MTTAQESPDVYRDLLKQLVCSNLITAQSIEIYFCSTENQWKNLDKMKDISSLMEEIGNKYLDIADMISSHFAAEEQEISFCRRNESFEIASIAG